MALDTYHRKCRTSNLTSLYPWSKYTSKPDVKNQIKLKCFLIISCKWVFDVRFWCIFGPGGTLMSKKLMSKEFNVLLFRHYCLWPYLNIATVSGFGCWEETQFSLLSWKNPKNWNIKSSFLFRKYPFLANLIIKSCWNVD